MNCFWAVSGINRKIIYSPVGGLELLFYPFWTLFPIDINYLISIDLPDFIGTIYEKKANNSGRQLDEVVKFRHFSSNEAAYR